MVYPSNRAVLHSKSLGTRCGQRSCDIEIAKEAIQTNRLGPNQNSKLRLERKCRWEFPFYFH